MSPAYSAARGLNSGSRPGRLSARGHGRRDGLQGPGEVEEGTQLLQLPPRVADARAGARVPARLDLETAPGDKDASETSGFGGVIGCGFKSGDRCRLKAAAQQAAMSTMSERWQHVESQLATKDRVHTFYARATALWDMKLDQFQRQLDTLLDGYGDPSSRGEGAVQAT
jgi:hypothetical protein